jgi:hypothetical protein
MLLASIRTIFLTLFCLIFGAALPAQVPGPGSLANGNGAFGQIALGSLLPASLPYRLNQGMIQVKIAIADGIPQDAVIATGLPLTVVSPALAVKQSLKAGAVIDLPTLLGPVKAASLPSQSLHLGRLLLSGVPLAVFDLSAHLSSKGLKEPPSIWLGTSALGGVVATIDPERQVVVLAAPTAPLPNVAVKVPFELRNGRIYLQVKFNDQKATECLLDTTAAGSLLPADICKALKLTPLTTFPTTNADGKPIKVSAIEIPLVSIGALNVKDVQAVYVSEGVDTRADAGTAVLGNDILLQYRVTIHYPQRILAFEAIKAPGTAVAVQPNVSATLPVPTSAQNPSKKKPKGTVQGPVGP